MKKSILKLSVLAFTSLLLMSFAIHGLEKKSVDVSQSSIEWLGKKVTGQHNGTIALKTGEVVLDHGKVVGGTFVVDMTTIQVLDIEGKWAAKLKNHLESDDFFGVVKHSEARFEITKIEGGAVLGDLTIKGHTEKVSFELSSSAHTISGTIKIDRTKYGIRYGSSSFFDNLKDKAIDNEFELTLNIVF